VRQAKFIGHLLRLSELLMDGRVGRATAHGEIVTRYHDGPPVDPTATEQQI
jgi:hypothetical protein